MKLPAPLLPAAVVARLNRFTVEVMLDGRPARAHLANSGRLDELLAPGTRCYVAPAPAPGRRTAYDLALVEYAGTLVSVDARKPNPLFEEALAERRLTAFAAYETWRREVLYNGCRIDFRLEAPGLPPCLVETKSCTLVVDGVALFPDAPTARGARHVRALIEARRAGIDAAVVWIVQRSDARLLRPWEEADPALTGALREARAADVRLLAYRCDVSLQEARVDGEIPVHVS